MDPRQATQIVKHVRSELSLPITDESITSMGKLFLTYNSKSGSSVATPMVGSTSNSYAVALDLESLATFSAVPVQGVFSTVTELVVRTSSATHVNTVTTIVIVPWLIEPTSELITLLRFHHMSIDAKPEIVHAIYHQLLTLGDEGNAEQLQFIVRIITSDRPLWVIDILAPFGFSPVRLNHHFTGNPAGDSANIELDGIPMQVIGGYGIQRAALRGFSHPSSIWANLPMNNDLPLRYLAHLLVKMGCDPKGTVSILYAKAETLRTNAKSKQDRHSLNQKAHSLAAPTIIFASPQYLKYFLDHFQTFVSRVLPNCVVGHSSDPLPRGPTQESFEEDPLTLSAFGSDRSFERYLSNIHKDKHTDLVLLKEDSPANRVDHFAAIDRLLARAKGELPDEEFDTGMQKLGRKYLKDTMDSVSNTLDSISVRDTSPNKRKATSETNDRARLTEAQRRALTLAEERLAAQTNLTYVYPMDSS